jgi:hypothetical protein
MNITEEKLLEYLSKVLVCVAVIVIGYIITRLIIGLLRKILNKPRLLPFLRTDKVGCPLSPSTKAVHPFA